MACLLQLPPRLARKVSNGELAFAQAHLLNEKAKSTAKKVEAGRKAEAEEQTHPLDRSIVTAMRTKLVHAYECCVHAARLLYY